MDVCRSYAFLISRSEKSDRSLGTGVTENCELLCGCWELTPSLLEEQLKWWPLSCLSIPMISIFLVHFHLKTSQYRYKDWLHLCFHFYFSKNQCPQTGHSGYSVQLIKWKLRIMWPLFILHLRFYFERWCLE